MNRFKLHQDVAVVEYDDATRKPREGGRILYAEVTAALAAHAIVRHDDGRTDVYAQETGWCARDIEYHWRLVPLCYRCQEPITGEPVTDGADDPLGREWCSAECHDDSGQAWMEQHYQNGVAT